MKMKYKKMNKKGVVFTLTIGMMIVAAVFLIFLLGGGLTTILDISKFIKSVPTFIWVVLGIII